MPGLCGKNSIGASGISPPVDGSCLRLTGLYTAVAGDVIDQFFFYGHDGWTAGGNVDIALYVFSGGVPTSRVHVPVNIVGASAVAAWQSSASGLAIPLVAGVQYCIGIAQGTAGRLYIDTVTNAISAGSSAGLADPHVEATINSNEYSCYANIIAGSGGGGSGSVGRPSIPFDPLFGDF